MSEIDQLEKPKASPSDELVLCAQDTVTRHNNLKNLLEERVIPDYLINAIQELDAVNTEFFYNPETREIKLATMDYQQMFALLNRLTYIYGQLAPMDVYGLKNFAYTTKQLHYYSEFDKARNSDRSDEIKKAYDAAYKELYDTEMRAILTNPKFKVQKDTEEWMQTLTNMAHENVRAKMTGFEKKIKIKTVSEKEAEAIAKENTLYDIKISDFLDAYAKHLSHKQQVARQMLDNLKQAMMSSKAINWAYSGIT